MSKFMIVGLPRSRTAWFSIAATTATSVCYHEPTARLVSFDDLATFWEDDRFEHVGISDSSLVMQLPRILDEIQPRTLIVSRPVDEAAESLASYFTGSIVPTDDALRLCVAAEVMLEAFRGHSLTRWLDYEAARDVGDVDDALRWLIPGATFPKLPELMHMNVQVDRDWVVREAMKPHTNWHLEA